MIRKCLIQRVRGLEPLMILWSYPPSGHSLAFQNSRNLGASGFLLNLIRKALQVACHHHLHLASCFSSLQQLPPAPAPAMAKPISIEVWNPSGKYRVVSTKSMPGTRWIKLLTDNDCRLEVRSACCSVSFLLLLLNCLIDEW